MIVWNSAWSEADRNSMLSSAIEGYLTGWAALAR
jgi:hypothetical protein